MIDGLNSHQHFKCKTYEKKKKLQSLLLIHINIKLNVKGLLFCKWIFDNAAKQKKKRLKINFIFKSLQSCETSKKTIIVNGDVKPWLHQQNDPTRNRFILTCITTKSVLQFVIKFTPVPNSSKFSNISILFLLMTLSV